MRMLPTITIQSFRIPTSIIPLSLGLPQGGLERSADPHANKGMPFVFQHENKECNGEFAALLIF